MVCSRHAVALRRSGLLLSGGTLRQREIVIYMGGSLETALSTVLFLS